MICTLPTIVIASLLSLVFADVEFTQPAAGANVEAGTIVVEWKDSGISPPIDELTDYTLALIVGGDTNTDALPLATFVSNGLFMTGNGANGTIPAGIAGAVDNGFYFRIISAAYSGGTVTNFSPRFSISGLTGITLPQYRNAVDALNGSTAGPARIDNVNGTSSTSAASSATPTSTTSVKLPSTTTSPSVVTVTNAVSKLDSKSSSLTVTAKAVVGAVVGAFVLIAIAITTWAFLRRRRTRQEPQRAYIDSKAELSGESLKESDVFSSVAELSVDSEKHEAADTALPPQLDHMAVRAELESLIVTETYELPAHRLSRGPD